MIKIVLPTMAVNIHDIKTRVDLLERMVGSQYEPGLEIIGLPEHFQKPEYLKQIKENISSVAKGLYLSVHGFAGLQVYESGLADMSTAKGRELLNTYVALAGDIGAQYVHVHGGAGYKGQCSTDKKFLILNRIKENLLAVVAKTDCKIGIENLPSPSMGDLTTDPDEVWRDYLESLDDCRLVIKETELKITFDTCHYAASQKEKIDLVAPAEKVKDYLHYLHISDIIGSWVPNKSVIKEGFIPGDGLIGKSSFKNFFSWIKDNCPNIGICVEVWNADLKNPLESEESIKRILKWLE